MVHIAAQAKDARIFDEVASTVSDLDRQGRFTHPPLADGNLELDVLGRKRLLTAGGHYQQNRKAQDELERSSFHCLTIASNFRQVYWNALPFVNDCRLQPKLNASRKNCTITLSSVAKE